MTMELVIALERDSEHCMKRPTVLAFSSWFLPGFKAGGPIRTLVNIIEQLGEDFCFKVVTRDRDLGDQAPYAGVGTDAWTTVGTTRVNYLGPGDRSLRGVRNTIRESRPDLLYLNSFFDPALSIVPLLLRRTGLIPRKIPMLIAPRGEFAPPALSIKARRKAAFLFLARLSGLCDGVIWQAGSVQEQRDVRAVWGAEAEVVVAPDLPPRLGPCDSGAEVRVKIPGSFRAVFLSRLAPIKNLSGALELLAPVEAVVEFDIYGPSEDPAYWEKCQQIIARLPANIRVRYLGPVANCEVAGILAQYHLLLLPTQGESFGHVILEALLAGCPVLISDQTPWQGLEERNAGWVVPLENPDRFREILQSVAWMKSEEYLSWCHGARRCGAEFSNDPALAVASRNLFLRALASTPEQNLGGKGNGSIHP